MVDGVMLLVDAAEGPLPQTRYVLSKALEAKLPPIVVINKIDRPDARAQEVLNEIYDLFIDLDATEDQLDFPVLYTNAKPGTASLSLDEPGHRPAAALRDHRHDAFPLPPAMPKASAADAGHQSRLQRLPRPPRHRPRLQRHAARPAMTSTSPSATARCRRPRSPSSSPSKGSKRTDITETVIGDIVAIAGVEGITIGETITSTSRTRSRCRRSSSTSPPSRCSSPSTTRPFAGREGQYVTSRNLRERLEKELLTNVSIRVEETGSPDTFKVLGRGELQLAILIEMMRREGYELMVGRPEIVTQRGRRQDAWSRSSTSPSTSRRTSSAS